MRSRVRCEVACMTTFQEHLRHRLKDGRGYPLFTMDDEFARALERLERFQQRDGDRIGAAGRTLALVHASRTPRAALLFHGLTASPMQFGNVARALFERGYNVLV